MPTLYVLSGPEVGKTFSVRDGDTLGRAPDRILTLRHASISRRHAHIEHQEGVWYVVDDGSQNGIVHQGERAERVALHDAAEFKLGEILLRFRLDQPAAPAASAPAPAPRQAPAAEAVEDEIFLEGLDDDPAGTPHTPGAPGAPGPVRLAGPAARTGPPAAGAAETVRSTAPRSGAGRAGGAAPGLSQERRVLQYQRREAPTGLGGADLAQYPGWVRALAVLLGLALLTAVAWLAFRGTSFVKREVTGGPAGRP